MRKNFRHITISILFILFYSSMGLSQDIFMHVANEPVYLFLDEMASENIIGLNTVIKPYSRKFIASKLATIKDSSHLLNDRQAKELAFYLKDFNKELMPDKKFDKRFDIFYYKDSLFAFSINVVGGLQFWGNENGLEYHRWNGAEAFATVGDFGFYANLRDNHETKVLSDEFYLNQRPGGNYKRFSDGSGDYSEMRGGVTFQKDWLGLAVVKDHLACGNNYNGSNIFSVKPPSFPMIKLNIKPVRWFEFNYIHAWLISEVVDTNRSYQFTNAYGTGQRDVFFNKYLAANMFSFQPLKNLWTSFGNSIVYSHDNVQPAYLIPVMFYKSVDHTLNATDRIGKNVGQNSQMFFDISSRQIKHLHLFATIFVDELSIARFTKPNEYNFVSFKAGFMLSNLPDNLFFNAEFVRTNPLTYKHNVPTTTFESNGYNLGHYLQDNSLEYYISLAYRPFRAFVAKASYTYNQHGPDHTSLGTDRVGIPFMESVEWSRKMFELSLKYQVINDGYLFGSYRYSNISGQKDKYTPEFFHGITNTFSLGVNFGF